MERDFFGCICYTGDILDPDRAKYDLSRAVQDLVARYHDERTRGARSFRLVVASYPAPAPERTA